MQSQPYTFDPRPDYPFVITAKRYWHPQLCSPDLDAVTLICTHGIGFSKEHWEPTLEELYGIVHDQRGRHSLKIREAWSIDAPNHGDGALLNKNDLRNDSNTSFRWEEYARAVHVFLNGFGASAGADVDFWSRKLVGVGHSMGAVALILANTLTPKIKFQSVMLVEPMMLPESCLGDPCDQFGVRLAKQYSSCALRRKEVWSDQKDILKCLRAKPPTNSWDSRIQAVFINHNLCERPTKDGLTLKCSREQEAACYRDIQSRAIATKYLRHLCSVVPVHFIYGEHDDLIPRPYQEELLRSATCGKYASETRIPGAGHLVLQTHPGSLAISIFSTIHSGSQHSLGETRCRL